MIRIRKKQAVRVDRFGMDIEEGEGTLLRVSAKYDPNQPRHPAGSPDGGRWADGVGGGGEHSISDKYMKDLLGYGEATDGRREGVDNPRHRYAEPGAWVAYQRMLEDEEAHDNAKDNIAGVDLYQSGYYQNINYALRFPDEMEMYESILYDLEEGDDYDQYNPWPAQEQAWQESGMADATNKRLSDMLVASDLTESSYLADEMAEGMEYNAPTLPKNLRLYRSFRHRDLIDNPEDYVGKVFTEKGFTSMTMSAHFAHRWNVGNRKAIMRLDTKGTEQGLHLTRGHDYGGQKDPYEFEVLLPAGTSFYIKRITESVEGDLLLDVDIGTGPRKKAVTREKSLGRNPDPVELPEPNPAKFAWDEDEARFLFPSQKYDPSQPRAPKGTPNGGQWVNNTVPRTAMPQILSSDLPDFYEYAREKGVRITMQKVRAAALKFRQAIDREHAEQMPKAALVKRILISKDNFVLDGNHRAAANAALGRRANVARINLNFKEAIDFMFTYPKVKNLEAAQEARKYDPKQPRAPNGTPEGGRWTSSARVEHGVTYRTYTSEDGVRVEIAEGAKYAPRENSVTDFVVPENLRGKGLGSSALDHVLANYPVGSVSAAASSEASVVIFHRKGFRPVSEPSATLGRALDIRAQDSSVTMAVPLTSVQKYDPNQPRHPKGHPKGGHWKGGVGSGADVIFEVAPDPNDKALTGRWNTLSDEQKQEISEKIAKELSDEVAEELGLKHSELVTKIGGYLGDTNPSMALNVDPDKAVAAAKLLGHGLSQDSMMLASSTKTPGLDEVEAVVVRLPKGQTNLASVRGIYDRIYKKVPEAAGFSLFGDQMTILNFPNWETGKLDTDTKSLAASIDKALEGRYDLWQDVGFSSFIENGDYLNAPDRKAGGRKAAAWRRLADNLRSQASKTLEEELGRRGKTQTRYRIVVKYDPNQPRAPAGTSNGGQWVSPGAYAASMGNPTGEFAEFDDDGLEMDTGTPEISAQEVEQGYFHFVTPNLVAEEPELEETPLYEELSVANSIYDTPEVAENFHELHAEEHMQHRYDFMSEDQADALWQYQTYNYRSMNDLAYTLDPEASPFDMQWVHSEAESVYNLDNAISDAPGIPAGTTVYRAFRNKAFAEKAHQYVGHTFRDRRFLSTSVSGQMVNNWARSKDDTENLVVLRLKTNKSINGLYLSRAREDGYEGGEPYEHEVLMPRGTPFTITRVKKVKLTEYDHDDTPVIVIDGVIG